MFDCEVKNYFAWMQTISEVKKLGDWNSWLDLQPTNVLKKLSPAFNTKGTPSLKNIKVVLFKSPNWFSIKLIKSSWLNSWLKWTFVSRFLVLTNSTVKEPFWSITLFKRHPFQSTDRYSSQFDKKKVSTTRHCVLSASILYC